jgi:IS5 family transposase
MEQQTSFTQVEYRGKKKPTRRERFLADMEKLLPWQSLVETITPFYPKGERGRPPMGVEKMLRIYFLQQWYALADEALEDALYDSLSLRAFVGVTGSEVVPDATTLLNFRHLLEEHDLTKSLFAAINAQLQSQGLLVREGTIVDATIIAAPSSTKNKARERDPEMHQTRKGNTWHFGMKAHIGVDLHSGVVHSLTGTAANVADIAETHKLLHGQEKNALGDAGYTGVEKRAEIQARFPSVSWIVARKRGKIRKMAEGRLKELTQAVEKQKAQLRAFVEHPFHVIKNLFRYRKVRYRGLRKNTAQLHSLFALANLVIARPCLLAASKS